MEFSNLISVQLELSLETLLVSRAMLDYLNSTLGKDYSLSELVDFIILNYFAEKIKQ